jgi:hypothetical protein
MQIPEPTIVLKVNDGFNPDPHEVHLLLSAITVQLAQEE